MNSSRRLRILCHTPYGWGRFHLELKSYSLSGGTVYLFVKLLLSHILRLSCMNSALNSWWCPMAEQFSALDLYSDG